MSKAEESLCERHREFVPLIAAIDKVEGELAQGSALLIRAETGGLHETLSHELIPHAVGEGRTLFPVLRRITGSDAATKEMLAEHREIARLTDELERIRDELARAGIGAEQEARMRRVLEHLKRAIQSHFEQEERMRRVLEHLKRAIQSHFEQEEQACFQVLKTELTPEQAQELYEAMERATKEIRRTYGCGGGRDFDP